MDTYVTEREAEKARLQAEQNARQEAQNMEQNVQQNTAQNVQQTAQTEDAMGRELNGKGRVPYESLSEDALNAWDNHSDVSMDAENRVYKVDPAQHISRRTSENVSDRTMNEFQFDHPELQVYYRQAAQALSADAAMSLDAPVTQKTKRGNAGKQTIREIMATPSLRDGMDMGLSRSDIIRAAENLAADHGQENNAAAKRLEIVLDKMLTEGYQTASGETVAPNEAYIKAKKEIPGFTEQVREELPMPDMDGVSNVYSRTNRNRSEAEVDSDILQVARAATVLGESGAKALTDAYDRATAQQISPEEAVTGFTHIYNAALENKDIPSENLPAHMRMAAEYAGQNDAGRAAQAKYFGASAMLVRDKAFKKAHLSSRTAMRLDALAKVLGVKIRFAEEVNNGLSNAAYGDGEMVIALDTQDPLNTAVIHEAIHRLRETNPKLYNELSTFIQTNLSTDRYLRSILERMDRYQNSDLGYLTEEMVADAFGRIMNDGKLLDRYVQDNRTGAEKLRDLLQDIVNAVRRVLNQQNLKLSREQKAEFQELEKQYSAMAQKLTKALDAAARQTAEQNKNAATTGGEVKYSAKSIEERRKETQAEVTAQYQQKVHDILNGTSQGNDALLVGYTPEIYHNLGMPDLPFVVGSGHVYSMAKTAAEAAAEGRSGANYHGLGESVVADIMEFVKEPIMVISAKDVNKTTTPMRSTHSVVALIDVGTAKNSLVIPVAITAERTVNGVRMDVNAISSAYERNVVPLVNEAIAQFNSGENSVFYVKKEAENLLGAGVQFPKRLKDAASSNGIVRKFDSKVNMSVQNFTQSQQFKRWFGDWQNHPDNASKVVNADGTPKIMYHGTSEQNGNFTVFDESKAVKRGGLGFKSLGKGNYFTATPLTGNERYGSRVIEAYLSIQKPLIVESGVTFRDAAAEILGESAHEMSYDELQAKMRKRGYDGVIQRNKSGDINIAVAFDSNQIKSATENLGTFDKSNPDIRYSLKQFDDGKRFVDVETDQAQFDGLSDKEKTKLAIRIIKDKFAGRVVGLDNRVFVNGRGAAEYGHPSKNIDSDIRNAKMRASTELDNLIDAGTNFRTEPDGRDGHVHPNAVGDFQYFDTVFKVGQEYYQGVINIEHTSRGLLFKDITKIENITQDISSSYGTNPKSTFLRDASMETVTQEKESVKRKKSKEEIPTEELLAELVKRYGAMPTGENPFRDIVLPKKTAKELKLSQTVRTILEAKATPEVMVPSIQELAADGTYSYQSYSDEAALSDAEAKIRDVGWGKALEDWNKAVRSGEVSKANTAMGWALYDHSANSGDTATALMVLNNMVEHQRSAAQAVQATRILKQMNPETQLYGVQRSVANLQKEINERYGKKGVKLIINEDLAERFMKAETQTERDNVLADIYRDIGRQMRGN